MPGPPVTQPISPEPGKSPKQFAGYEVEGELGRGGMGVVYLARQSKLKRRVALKMLTGHYGKEELTRFVAEAETAAGLHHTNIAQIYEVGEHEGAPFYSMEYVEGGSLGDRLRKAAMPLRDAVQLLTQVARALHFAHQNGVVHRDMKPANVLLDPDGIPKVADFGIAKRLKEDTKLTLSGAIIGTPTYMAPEQAKGTSRHVGPAADVYALGAILYEVLAGRPPFLPEDSETALTVRVLTEDPVSPAWHRPGTPRDLETICMKCLEKEPRDRYVSAAAFAEDLRRYLDDETILAKPPTAVTKAVKWTRRHPWKFVTAAMLGLGVAAGVWWLFQWEFYQRSHSQYATEVDYRFGGPESLSPISAADVGRRAHSLRFTRRGRWGPVTRVESINARGYPANVSQFFNFDPLPNWIEGGFGVQEEPKKTREATSIDFIYEDKVAREVIAHDCNGMLIWHVIYDRPGSSGPNRVHARYVTSRGFDFASRSGASVIEFERDSAGRDAKIRFFNGSGQPAANSEGVYGYSLERDAAGRLVHVNNLGKDGTVAENVAGYVALAFTRDAHGLVTRCEFRDAKDKPATSGGMLALAIEYDSTGNNSRLTHLNEKDRPTNAGTWAAQEISRNEHGEIAEQRFYSASATGELSLVSKRMLSYDEHSYPNDIRFAGKTSWRTALVFDQRGNVLEEKILGTDGQLVPGPEGWAIHKHGWQFSGDGSREEETWFDEKGAPTYAKGGEHRRISEFDAAGNLHRFTTDGHDPKRFAYQRYVCEPEYDAEGRQRRNVVYYQDADGKPATEAGLGFTARDLTLDENEREVLEWKLGCDVKEVGAPVLRIETEWQRSGARKRVVRQVCDENRKPVAVISNGNAAYFEQDFNELDELERIYEKGFDEKVVGFTSREAKFTSGRLQSVIHSRSDGSQLDNIRVIIKSIMPEQPKAGELRPGDQLVIANDKPVTSAYGWVAAGTFPGGWIDVIRDGKRVRIDGFQPGPLGIVLEDHAEISGR